MTTIYTGEEGKRIRMAIYHHFLESRRKNFISAVVGMTLRERSKQLSESLNRMSPAYESSMLEKGAAITLNAKEHNK